MSDYTALFLGQKPTGEAAWRTLQRLNDGSIEIAAIATNTSPADVWWGSAEIYDTAGSEIPIIGSTERNNHQLLEIIENKGVDLILCVHHPWILPGSILEAVDYNAVTIHNAPLPEDKGYNTVNHAILNGDDQFSSSALWMAEEVDSGDLIYEGTFSIESDETAISLYIKAHYAAIAIFGQVITDLIADRPLPAKSMTKEGTFYPRESIEGLRQIEAPDSLELKQKSRAFFFPPFEPAYVQYGTNRYHVVPDGAYDKLTASNGTADRLFDVLLEKYRSVSIQIQDRT
uniref:WbcV protein n=1 Tax=uncultured haloarchaeon TaxID=160804 RepID=A5YSQ4_9EURY|nr:WbcV protein [uncultured haloarchaeon]